MTKILITGANSFVGKNFTDKSSFTNVDEICLINNNVGNIDFVNYDVVLHVAAIVHQTKSIPESTYYQVNTNLCLDVALQAKKMGVKQFIFISTVKVYGEFDKEKGPWTENSQCYPNDPYGKSKYAAEKELMKLNDEHFTVSIIRPPLIYGKGVKANMLSIIKLVDNYRILPLGGINNKRSFTSIENLVYLIDLAIEKRKSGVFLAMDKKSLSTTELTQIIAEQLNKNVKLLTLPGFVVSIGNIILPSIFSRLYGSFEIDNSLTCKTLEYHPKYSTTEGIKSMLDAYLTKKK